MEAEEAGSAADVSETEDPDEDGEAMTLDVGAVAVDSVTGFNDVACVISISRRFTAPSTIESRPLLARAVR